MPSKRKTAAKKAARQKKASRLGDPKRKDSNYRAKRKHLVRHGGNGFDYEEKPWKK